MPLSRKCQHHTDSAALETRLGANEKVDMTELWLNLKPEARAAGREPGVPTARGTTAAAGSTLACVMRCAGAREELLGMRVPDAACCAAGTGCSLRTYFSERGVPAGLGRAKMVTGAAAASEGGALPFLPRLRARDFFALVASRFGSALASAA